METVIPRNSGEMITQGQEVKKPFMMPAVENAAGNQSGVSTTAGMGTTAGKLDTGVEYQVKDVNQSNATRQPYLNISASEENRGAKWRGGAQDVPEGARNQFQ